MLRLQQRRLRVASRTATAPPATAGPGLFRRPHRARRPRRPAPSRCSTTHAAHPAQRAERHRLRRAGRLLLHRSRQGAHRDWTAAPCSTPRPTARSSREVAFPMMTPNGIGLSPDGKTLYVAETETARLWAFADPGARRARARSPGPRRTAAASSAAAAATSASIRWRSRRTATSASPRWSTAGSP